MLQNVLHLEWRGIREYSPSWLARSPQDAAEHPLATLWKRHRQKRNTGLAIIDRAVRVEKILKARQELRQSSPFDALFLPGNIAHRAGPRFGGKYGGDPFDERSVERGIVGDYDVRLLHKCFDCGDIQPVTSYKLVCQASDCGYLGGNRVRWLIELVQRLSNRNDSLVKAVFERRDGDFDYLADANI